MIKQIFTWWNSQTFGTLLYTIFFGKLVGKDEFGNKQKLRNWSIGALPHKTTSMMAVKTMVISILSTSWCWLINKYKNTDGYKM